MTFDVTLNRLWSAKTVSVRQKPNPVNPGNPAHDLQEKTRQEQGLHGHVYQDGHACQADQVSLIGHLQVFLIVHLYTICKILVSNAPTPEWLPQPRWCLKNLILEILEILQILLMIYKMTAPVKRTGHSESNSVRNDDRM